jgi:uncharacterized protein (AIM24 family)
MGMTCVEAKKTPKESKWGTHNPTHTQVDGLGVLIFSGWGGLAFRELKEGEQFDVDQDNLVAWQWGMRLKWIDVVARA